MPNTYALLINVMDPIDIEVGALGPISFELGYYVYIGSARSTEFERIQRHIRTAHGENDTQHWHIDYLLSHENAKLLTTYTTDQLEECALTESFDLDEIDDFGCSDCDCNSHLKHGTPAQPQLTKTPELQQKPISV